MRRGEGGGGEGGDQGDQGETGGEGQSGGGGALVGPSPVLQVWSQRGAVETRNLTLWTHEFVGFDGIVIGRMDGTLVHLPINNVDQVRELVVITIIVREYRFRVYGCPRSSDIQSWSSAVRVDKSKFPPVC